jgi:hypothetical protein
MTTSSTVLRNCLSLSEHSEEGFDNIMHMEGLTLLGPEQPYSQRGQQVPEDGEPGNDAKQTGLPSYVFVDSYTDHHWDLVHGDDVLSDGIYYHILQPNQAYTPPPTHETTPVLTNPFEAPVLNPNLIRPQAFRVVCPAAIAPMIRHANEEGDDSYASEGSHGSFYLDWYRAYLEEEVGNDSFDEAREAVASIAAPIGTLGRPQALRMLCPTTIAPVVRKEDKLGDDSIAEPAKEVHSAKDFLNRYLVQVEEDKSEAGWSISLPNRTTAN